MPSLRLWFFSIFNTHQGPSHITFSSTAAEQGSSSRKSLNELRSTQCMRIQEVSSSVFLISLFGLSALLWLELLTARGLGDLDILKNHVVTALQIPLPLWRNSRTKLFQSAWASPIETAFVQRFHSSYSYHIYSLTLPYSKNARHELMCRCKRPLKPANNKSRSYTHHPCNSHVHFSTPITVTSSPPAKHA